MLRPAFAEINLGAFANNIRELNRLKKKNALFMAVVKADGYGHGAVPVAETAIKHGADYLAVGNVAEAIELREAGLDEPILIFGWTSSEDEHLLLEYNLIQTIYSLEQAESLSREAQNKQQKAKVHLKIDTGMGRVGFQVREQSKTDILKILQLAGMDVEGIFTHFADADNKKADYTEYQFDRFLNFAHRIEMEGLSIPIKHCANSAAIIDYPETHLDMVRAGISMYGLYPSQAMCNKLKLEEVMTLKAKIVNLKYLSAQESVSYSRTYYAKDVIHVATVPLGYADGYSRLLSNKARVMVKNEFAPVIGRVCMDQFMIDVTQIPGDIQVGEEVTMFGRDPGGKFISIDEIASLMGTISYEVICLIGKRVPRIYINTLNAT